MDEIRRIEIGNYIFSMTCDACPEQYDVYDKTHEQVGYVRLRNGILTAECPCVNGKLVYMSGYYEPWIGMFPNDTERTRHLTKIADAIDVWRSSTSYYIPYITT